MPAPRLLWVTEEAPDRSLGGGNIRQAHLFLALAAAHEVELLSAAPVRDPAIVEAAAGVRAVDAPPPRIPTRPRLRRAQEIALWLGYPYPLELWPASQSRRALARAILSRKARADLILVEHETLAPLVGLAETEPWLMTFHNLLSGRLRHEIELAPGARQRRFREWESAKARRLEREALLRYAACVTCSEEDARLLADIAAPSEPTIHVVPNGVDLEQFAPTPLPDAPVVLFPGTLAYGPNVEAAGWLAEEIFPRVREAVPEARLVIAGRGPTPAVRALARRTGVTVIGDVPSMVELYRQARAVAVPIRVGTGTRLKALEAMAAGRPVAGTHVGLEGLAVAAGEQALIADGTEGLAGALTALLTDRGRAEELARAARLHVEERFGWNRVGAHLIEAVDAALDRRSVSS